MSGSMWLILMVYLYISVVIDSGPRYEVAYPSGVSHFLEKLAFNVSPLLIHCLSRCQ